VKDRTPKEKYSNKLQTYNTSNCYKAYKSNITMVESFQSYALSAVQAMNKHK